MSNTNKPPRQLPRVWRSFWSLRVGDSFSIGKLTFVKRGFLAATAISSGTSQLFYPWIRVRSGTLVRDARPGGKSSTHYVGDECPGRHLGDDQCRERIEQPNSDNDVHAPTS